MLTEPWRCDKLANAYRVVLILVVKEDALRDHDELPRNQNHPVLILVVKEDALRAVVISDVPTSFPES